MQVYDLIISVSEQPKGVRNGTEGYIINKFKITGIDGLKKEAPKA